jgi:polysaccharide pyruvyl transferase WcaK-like protein
VVTTDSVIALSDYFRELLPKNISKQKEFSIGISVRSGYHHNEIAILKDIVKQLRKQYPQSTIYGLAYSHREDASLVSDTPLLQSLGLDEVITNHEDILKILPTLDIMVATRLHALITARLINIPTLCLSYAKKTREIHNMLDA